MLKVTATSRGSFMLALFLVSLRILAHNPHTPDAADSCDGCGCTIFYHQNPPEGQQLNNQTECPSSANYNTRSSSLGIKYCYGVPSASECHRACVLLGGGVSFRWRWSNTSESLTSNLRCYCYSDSFDEELLEGKNSYHTYNCNTTAAPSPAPTAVPGISKSTKNECSHLSKFQSIRISEFGTHE